MIIQQSGCRPLWAKQSQIGIGINRAIQYFCSCNVNQGSNQAFPVNEYCTHTHTSTPKYTHKHTHTYIHVEMEMLWAWDDQCITLQDINIINETLHAKFMNDTLKDIANSTKFPKLRTYKLFKKDFRLENYLIEIENTKHALALARFRISSHNLRIETGRYGQRKIKPEERLCIYCRSKAVEDEQHFVTMRTI